MSLLRGSYPAPVALVLFVPMLFTTGALQAAPRTKLAVMEIRAQRGVDRELTQVCEEFLATQIAEIDRYEVIARDDFAAYTVQMVDVHTDGSKSLAHLIRLFKNQPGVRYARRVHNQIAIPGPVAQGPVRVFHYGYDLDPAAMARKHQRRLDMSPQRFYKALRLEHANRLLTQSDLSITEIAVATGFASASHFARCFREAYGQTPSETRRRALKAA